ncbi:amino acid ABC transporter ATP-binding protein [Weissella halotolerans]|nr:amino acid ABC transporter ATP-binding protein [Weissella halotolerans]
MTILTLEKLHKEYQDRVILESISAKVTAGDVIAILGASGAGKSTLLRELNMLERPTSGHVIFEGQYLEALKDKELDQVRQDIGMVFQSFNLFPNMTVIDNITLALVKLKGQAKGQAEKTANQLLAKVGLSDFAGVYPASLSGGQKQRVAIARALAMEPKIMLFDEPTSALDPQMVKEVLKTMQSLADEGMTMLVVTHELGFAREVANKVWFMADGQIDIYQQSADFFERPRSLKAQQFLATMM